MEEKFGWCFIGTGKLAGQVADQIKKSSGHKIVSCYTRNFEKSKAFAAAHGCRPCETALEAMCSDGVEGVYVVTPHNAHYAYVKMALEAGKPVLCEKAFTVYAKDAEELVALAREKDVYLCEAMWTWFSPAANKVKDWVAQGAIGKISEAHFTFHMGSIGYAPRVSDPARAGGALLDITVYPITYAYRLFGMPVKIESKGTIENGIDMGEEVVLHFAGGEKANISASIKDTKGFEIMTIKGESGKITAPLYHANNKVTLCRGLFQKEVFCGPGPKMNSYMDEFDTVAREIRDGRKESAMVPLQATLDVMHIMETIMKQIGLKYDHLE